MQVHAIPVAHACESWRKRLALAAAVLCAGWLLSARPAVAQASAPAESAPAAAGHAQPAESPAPADHATPPAAPGQPAAEQASAHEAAEGAPDAHEGGEEHGSVWPLVGKVVNFAILVGTLVYFLRMPFTKYLGDRDVQIRTDLTTAARMKEEAAQQVAALEAKLRELPHEIDNLRSRGHEEVAAEEARIRAEADAERERLLEQTRREIDVQLRIARRDLVTHAADLAVQVARERIAQRITDQDQQRLVDRYLEQVKQV